MKRAAERHAGKVECDLRGKGRRSSWTTRMGEGRIIYIIVEMAALRSLLNYNYSRSITLARSVRDVGSFSSATVERLQVPHS